MRWNVAKRPWQVKQSWLEVESIHILLDTKFTSPPPPLSPPPSLSCLLCLFFLIVFWFTLLAGYYGRHRRGRGGRGNYLPSRVRCHSELPPVESVGDQMDAPGQFLVSQAGRERERERERARESGGWLVYQMPSVQHCFAWFFHSHAPWL